MSKGAGMRRRARRRKKGCLGVAFMALFLVLLLGAALFFIIGVLGEGSELFQTQEEEIPYQEVWLEEGSLDNKYYYGQIPEEERDAYQEILQGIQEQKEQIYVHSGNADRTNALFSLVLKDFPEIFWCDGRASATAYTGGEDYTVLEPEYLYSGEEKETRQREIEAAAEEWLAGISAKAGDYEKIQYVYETIVNTVEYDENATDNQNIYSVFVNRRSVCAGYSKAAQYLLERLGVFCTYVTGKTVGNQNHAWNLVICEGDYYYVDTTWGDPVFQSEEGSQEQGYINYDYLCCSDEELFRTHTPDADVTLPECTKMDWNYYVVNGMYYTEYDGEQILKDMNEVISQGGNPSVFKFSDSQVYEQAKEGIFGDLIQRAADNLARWYGLAEVRYRYLDEEAQNKITIYWQYE